MKKSDIMRILAILSAALLCLCISGCGKDSIVTVAEGRTAAIRWALDNEGCLSFTGAGALPGVEYSLSMETGQSETIYPEWYAYREQVTNVVIGSGIDSISMNAFMNFPLLSDIDMSTSVRHIYGYAVTGCPSLERITIRCSTVEMEKYCIGFVGGTAEDCLEDIVFKGRAGSDVEKYADSCGADFRAL